jgi:hypothetical protein
MKKVFAFFSAFALAGVGSAMALDVESGFGYHAIDQAGAYDCDGAVKWEQLPNGVNGYSSQVDVCYPFDSATADNFVGDGETLIGAAWWGIYWGGTPVVPSGFYVTVYADAGGVPNTPPPPGGAGIMSWYVPAPFYNETFSSASEADYCFNVADATPPSPFLKEDGARYWISFQAEFCFPPQWGWTTGSGDGVDVQFGFPLLGTPYWTAGALVFGVPSDMGFFLLNETDGTPTEDTTWSTIKNLYR